MEVSEIVREARSTAGLSVRGLAEAAGVSPSTVHRIERGRLIPTVDMVERVLAPTGLRARLETVPDPGTVAGLARAISADHATDPDDRATPVRRAADFASRFHRADRAGRVRMLADVSPPTADEHWDAFLAGLAEWLGVTHDVPAPAWTTDPGRFLDHGWWITTARSLRAWEYAGSPVSFQRRGVYLHRDSLVNV